MALPAHSNAESFISSKEEDTGAADGHCIPFRDAEEWRSFRGVD